jgi:hypothetical protein
MTSIADLGLRIWDFHLRERWSIGVLEYWSIEKIHCGFLIQGCELSGLIYNPGHRIWCKQ